ncbi:P-loop containing nucleoside triphosphate hydrolase protein [Mucor mucedo]|uniref:P-loop containing nucleoside triphosphate hydrolase protein n=1 Tax=Mucor mucedo TaxID=29922 RepID=UPI00221ED07E|nr:P-loop containing nucleoside triphosphate hydrolase protein [Mucor mucedo]KAI7896256.1 P-loop containing nucleoside triphosphate hydrolase protein [Mucor mucedo]
MEILPSVTWVSVSLPVVASVSAVALSIQRGLYHKRQQQEEGGISLSTDGRLPLRTDSKRDLSVPFDDTNRITRITYCTLLLATLSAMDLYANVTHVKNDPNNVHLIASSTGIFISWLYAFVLAITSRHYRLPNEWGWVLNVHLCIFYTIAFCFSVYQFCLDVIIGSPQMPWLESLSLLLPVLLGFDLVYVTATMKQGPPFLDEKDRPVCNINVDSIFGKLSFNWVTNVVRVVSKKKGEMTDQDLPVLTPEFRAHNIFYIFGASRGKGSLLYRLLKANAADIVIQVSLAIIASFLYYAPAFFMNRLLQLLQDVSNGVYYEDAMMYGTLIVIGMGVSIVILGIITGQLWYHASCSLQTRVRTMLNVEVYQKSLRRRDLSVASSEKADDKESKDTDKKEDEDSLASTGAIINLMGTDASRIADFAAVWFAIISAPLELITGFYFLYQLMGVSCFYGLLIMIVILPINHFNAKIFSKTQDRLMEARDKRVSLMNEVLLGIRQIKFFAWEKKWEERIMEARNLELHQLSITYVNGVFFSLVWQGAPILVTLVSFFAFTKIQGYELNAPIAFTAISIFAELRYALNVIPETLIDSIQALSSLKRITKFLEEDEIDPVLPGDNQASVKIGFENATIGWKKPLPNQSTADEEASFILKNIVAEFPNNELSLVSGSTGSGKTLMLLGLLGEAILLDGKISCPRVPLADTIFSEFGPISEDINSDEWILDRSLAYVSQTPWLQNASIRDNILFGFPYIESRYNNTLTACALDKDLSIFEDGDGTEIGEKGITLSGGQKARVALARAVYSRAKNVLMDDVLSAVDAHTAKHLYDNCLMGPLMRNRTRILVTHHIKLCIKGCSFLVHIDNGRAGVVGSPEELRQSGALQKIIEEDNEFEDDQDASEEAAIENIDNSSTTTVASGTDTNTKKDQKAARVLVEDETRASGAVKFRLYKIYFSMVGNAGFWLVMTLFVIGARSLEIGESWWIKIWAQSYTNNPNDNTTISAFNAGLGARTHDLGMMMMPDFSQTSVVTALNNGTSHTSSDGVNHLNYYLSIYCLITCGNVIVGSLRYALMYWGALKANRQLYGSLLHRVFRAPLRFFDTTPTGRILNRFAKDFEAVDSKIPSDFMLFVVQWFMIITTAITVCVVMPALFIPMFVIAAINIFVGLEYVKSSREFKRLDSVTRSPIFSNFTETISGVATIRAFGASQQFLQVMMECIDANVRPFVYSWTVNRWVSVRYSMTSAVVNFSACAIVLYNMDKIDVALAGFALSFVLLFTDNMFWGIRQYTGLEMSFNAIERIVEFMEMDQEAAAISSFRPPPQWPTQGEIEVKDLEVRYAADLDPVLKGLTFSVKPQEKIGIVGRTGSGKSTLALSFFRFVEASQGSITIDNIDIKDLGTEDLRSNLTIIPQDPTLFSGTLRSNMDPFQEFQDEDIIAALQRVHLVPSSANSSIQSFNSGEEVNANVFKDLDTNVSEGGKNFSQGQRQLLCLGRALLKSSRVVLMDEATASVDFETDKAIQKTITTEFSDSTILCIAHRLHTVIEYDRILLLDQGRIIEFDNPLTLINNPESSFYKMCRNSGEFDSLLELAKSKHQLVEV